MQRVAILGPPTAGKTTASRSYKRVCHGDGYIPMGWSEASAYVATLLDDPTIECYEGVVLARAIRKWLGTHRTGKPVDRVIYLERPRSKLTVDQQRMAAGIRTVWDEIRGELVRRGVVIEYV